MKALKASAEKAQGNTEGNPGVKLLDFYESLSAGGGSTSSDIDGEVNGKVDGQVNGNVSIKNSDKKREGALDVTKTVQHSASLKKLESVGPEWMAKWLTAWGF